jgi:hypothetical protein
MIVVFSVVFGVAIFAGLLLLALAAFGVWRPAQESPARWIGAVWSPEAAWTVPKLTVVGGVEGADAEPPSEELQRHDPAA